MLMCLLFTAITVTYFQYSRYQLLSSGFYPLEEVLDLAGYSQKGETSWIKTENGLAITLTIDYDTRTIDKNGYQYEMESVQRSLLHRSYVNEASLENVLLIDVSHQLTSIQWTQKHYTAFDWAKKHQLVAHAGGAVRTLSSVNFYTNSLEALKQNYSLGQRVFEIDFYLTSDRKLAAVHDWTDFGNQDGQALSSEEWRNFQAYGNPMTDERFTTMMLEDVLEQMLLNKDMLLVTDTKSTEVSEEDMLTQFQELYDEAVALDPELLQRIIPQVYNQDMYAKISQIYDYPSVIYTLYASTDSADDVLSFVAAHDNIQVVTMPYADSRLEIVDDLHVIGKKVFIHTINGYDQLTTYASQSVDGFYVDYLLPEDVSIYRNLRK